LMCIMPPLARAYFSLDLLFLSKKKPSDRIAGDGKFVPTMP
jgi:hypothetical protein